MRTCGAKRAVGLMSKGCTMWVVPVVSSMLPCNDSCEISARYVRRYCRTCCSCRMSELDDLFVSKR